VLGYECECEFAGASCVGECGAGRGRGWGYGKSRFIVWGRGRREQHEGKGEGEGEQWVLFFFVMRDVELIFLACVYFSANDGFPALNPKRSTLCPMVPRRLIRTYPAQPYPHHTQPQHHDEPKPAPHLRCRGRIQRPVFQPLQLEGVLSTRALGSSTPQTTSRRHAGRWGG